MDEEFALFWHHYPKKVGKAKTKIIWDRMYKKGEIPDIKFLLLRLDMQIAHKKRCKEQNVFCAEFPDPERWVKYKRWDDEVSDESSRKVERSAVVPRPKIPIDSLTLEERRMIAIPKIMGMRKILAGIKASGLE
jgi:hypothetical protein